MARKNLYNNQMDVTRPPESYADAESIIAGATVPDDNEPMRMEATQPEYSSGSPRGKGNRHDDAGETVPSFKPKRRVERTIIDDELKTEQMPEQSGHRNRRVVGWMVGVRGICRGVDYRLHEGKNYIGRDRECDVEINDPKVSVGNVAQVVFDPRSKRFFSSDCDGTSTICYQNGEPLLGRSELKRYDRIELGDSELLFIPLCGEEFTWSEEEKGKEKSEE